MSITRTPLEVSIEDLYATNCLAVPNSSGVYFVTVPQGFEVVCDDTLARDHPHYGLLTPRPVDTLCHKFYSGDGRVLYIGKSQNLRTRIKQLVGLGYGEGFAHRGGRALWQLRNNKKLLVSWVEHENPQAEKNRLLHNYRQAHGVLPLANWAPPNMNRG